MEGLSSQTLIDNVKILTRREDDGTQDEPALLLCRKAKDADGDHEKENLRTDYFSTEKESVRRSEAKSMKRKVYEKVICTNFSPNVRFPFLTPSSDLNDGLERSKKVFPDTNKNEGLTLHETDMVTRYQGQPKVG